MRPPFMEDFFWGFWELLPIVLWVAFWALVIAAVILVVRGSSPTVRSSGLRILEERYARGEIGRDEFLERRAVLRRDESETSSS